MQREVTINTEQGTEGVKTIRIVTLQEDREALPVEG
jgi:hypothetical protein